MIASTTSVPTSRSQSRFEAKLIPTCLAVLRIEQKPRRVAVPRRLVLHTHIMQLNWSISSECALACRYTLCEVCEAQHAGSRCMLIEQKDSRVQLRRGDSTRTFVLYYPPPETISLKFHSRMSSGFGFAFVQTWFEISDRPMRRLRAWVAHSFPPPQHFLVPPRSKIILRTCAWTLSACAFVESWVGPPNNKRWDRQNKNKRKHCSGWGSNSCFFRK